MIIETSDLTIESILNSNPLVIACFHADYCGLCKEFYPKFKRLSLDKDNATILFIHINVSVNEDVAKLAQVDSLPYIASFIDGKLLEGVGTNKEEHLQKMINNLRK